MAESRQLIKANAIHRSLKTARLDENNVVAGSLGYYIKLEVSIVSQPGPVPEQNLRLQGVHQSSTKTSYPASVQTSLFTQAFLPVDRQALLGSSTDMLIHY